MTVLDYTEFKRIPMFKSHQNKTFTMHDIVFPNGNEQEFIKIAEKLGIKSLSFVYSEKNAFYTKKEQFPYTCAILCTPDKINSMQSKKIPFVCKASREAIERGAPLVFEFETLEEKEHTHFRRSGLNHILCELATRKKTTIGLSIHSILAEQGRKRAILLGRMMQNIILLRKYKTSTKLASFAAHPNEMRAPFDIVSLFATLGMKPEEAKAALNFNPFK